ncbi:MAG: plasmid pRiA4b ORF-3 family protein [Anaerolineales bacterium]|nr:MAG: plasmid pRiA4b ORF-3 family protein [Anaerolineales bacterium]
MYRQSPKEIKFLPEHERVLRGLTINESGPGTVLHDFDAFLMFIKEQEPSVTPMHQLRRRVLPEINARLARPFQLGLKKPLQKSYPHIHGLYLLVRASGLTCIEGTAKKPLLIVDDAVYQVWEGLNPTERYCTLLETWLLRGHPEIIGERGRSWFRIPETFGDCLWLFHRIPDEGMPVASDKGAEDSLRYLPGWHNLGLLELFGLVSVRHGPPEPGKGWRIEWIGRTPLGDALLALLQAKFFGDMNNILQLEEKIPFGVLQPALQAYFPKWENNLSIPEWAFREGTHIFKVSLGRRIWRRIAIPADQTLDALAWAILNAVEFDHDHLYEFKYQNRFGVLERINHPYMEDEGPWTDEVLIGDVPLRVGQTMTYVFDFGDRWEFGVTLERVDPDMVIEKPVVLEKHGEPPAQYGW